MTPTATNCADEAPACADEGPACADHRSGDARAGTTAPTRRALSRRGVLGALAAGAAAVACGPGGGPNTAAAPSGAAPAAPPPNGQIAPAGGGGATALRAGAPAANATGPELDQVQLPGPPVHGGDGTTAGPAGGGATSPGPPVAAGSPPAGAPGAGSPSAPPAAPQPPAAPAPTDAPTGAAPAVITPRAGAAPGILLANRITFGITPAVLSRIDQLGGGGFVDEQLARTGPDPEVESGLGSFAMLRLNPSLASYNAVQGTGAARLRQELTLAAITRAVASRHQLYEMMCHLWMDHFNIEVFGDGTARHLLVDYQEKVIRPNALGSFRNLLKATAQAPAMLAYLDNDTSNANSKQGINENYGRELLELHTLGIAPDGTQVYTEADVRAAAMAMTGWSTVSDRKAADFSAFVFRPQYQHTGDISLLDGAWTRGGAQGKAVGDSLLEFLAVHPATARHVARRICRRLVADNPPASLVESTAQVYLASNTELVPTVRHVLDSAEMAASGGQKLRRPFEHLAAMLRALGTALPTDPASEGAVALQRHLERTDHLPWSWPQPDGFPDTAPHWLNTSALLYRWSAAGQLAGNRIKGVQTDLGPLVAGGGTVGDLVNRLATRFGLGNRTAEEISAVAASVRKSPGDPADSIDPKLAPSIPGLLLAHPIFQTR
ncbi:MAG: DUF1800 domain-containing protein [Acidimicrobiales bacterium]